MFDTRGQRRDDRWMVEIEVDDARQLGVEEAHLTRRQMKLEDLDGDQTVATGLMSTKNGAERPEPDLVKNTKRTKCLRGKIEEKVVVVRMHSEARC